MFGNLRPCSTTINIYSGWDVTLNHRTSLTSQSVLCELCVVECVGGSEAA